MQPEIYCRWLCADGSTRCRRGRRRRRRRRWALALGYRTAAIDWRGRDVVLDVVSLPPIDTKHGALPARRREKKLVSPPSLRQSRQLISLSLDRSIDRSTSILREKQENIYLYFVLKFCSFSLYLSIYPSFSLYLSLPRNGILYGRILDVSFGYIFEIIDVFLKIL